MKYKVGDVVSITDNIENLIEIEIDPKSAREIAGELFTIQGVDKNDPWLPYKTSNFWIGDERITSDTKKREYKVGDRIRLTDDVDKLVSIYITPSNARMIAGHEYVITSVRDCEEETVPIIGIDTMADVGSEYYVNEDCIVSVEGAITDHMSKAYLFSYWLNSACYEPEKVVIIAASQQEANKKFYTRVAEKDFKEIKVVCEEVEMLS